VWYVAVVPGTKTSFRADEYADAASERSPSAFHARDGERLYGMRDVIESAAGGITSRVILAMRPRLGAARAGRRRGGPRRGVRADATSLVAGFAG